MVNKSYRLQHNQMCTKVLVGEDSDKFCLILNLRDFSFNPRTGLSGIKAGLIFNFPTFRGVLTSRILQKV